MTGLISTEQRSRPQDPSESKEASNGKFRIVAMDMDGTLLRPDHKISQASIDYLNYLHKRGIVIIIATGRCASTVYNTVNHINLNFTSTHENGNGDSNVDPSPIAGFPLVCSNGSCGLKVSSCGTLEKPLFYEPVPEDVTKKAIALANQRGLTVQYYLGKEIHIHAATYGHRNLARRYSQLTGIQQKEVRDQLYDSVINMGLPSKLLVLCEEEQLDDVTAFLRKELAGVAHIIRGTPPFFVEILHKDVCKGYGLRRLLDSLNEEAREKYIKGSSSIEVGTIQTGAVSCSSFAPYSLDEVVAFGDGDNDIEFLQLAGRGIAMNNARQNLKHVADEVIQWTNEQDGVILKLQEMEEEGLLALSKIDN